VKTHFKLCVVSLFLLATASAQENAPLVKYSWLSGCWSVTTGPVENEEQWNAPKGQIMTGMGRTVKKGKTVFFDFFRIEARKDGIVYIAQPKGTPPTEFKLVSVDPHKLVFENLQHDFPKRIIYKREANGNVTARVEGSSEQANMAEEWKYSRDTCGSAD
jgi:hypothetical protein